MEETLGRIARETCVNSNSDACWQAVADAVVAAYEARRWRAIETMDEVTVENVIAGKRAGSRWLTAEFCRKYLAINAGYTHWTPIPAPPKEASDAE